ncbi:hypothetical protein NTGBS_880017 [Candidatus Nitrotoga sp. BS]|nr:hypothetical protein NTGBS_880017 [Candidatus Nitrotoga sp. BS]
MVKQQQSTDWMNRAEHYAEITFPRWDRRQLLNVEKGVWFELLRRVRAAAPLVLTLYR